MNLKKDLESQGYSVRIVTRRKLDNGDENLYTMGSIREFKLQQFLNPKGGEVEVRIKHVGRFAKGVAKCHPKDVFNKKLGLQMAFKAALEQLV